MEKNNSIKAQLTDAFDSTLHFLCFIINWRFMNLTLCKQMCCLRANTKSDVPVPGLCTVLG